MTLRSLRKQRPQKPESIAQIERFGFGLKKTYTLAVEGKNPDRLLEASKHDIRKYVKRERAKLLPADVDFWDFDCKLGTSPADLSIVHLSALTTAVDSLVASGAHQFYVEVVARPGHRVARPAAESATESPEQIQVE